MVDPHDIAALGGLTSAEAASRLARDGPNELPQARPRSLPRIAAGVVREPMFLLLLACGGIYLALGDVREALTLLSFVLVVIAITVFQERRTERALDALRDLTAPRAHVVRDDRAFRVPGRDVVAGDVVLLAEGDRVPADGAVLAASNLHVDESLLTGESAPVRKSPSRDTPGAPAAMGPPGGDDAPWVFSGTLAVRGHAAARVLATGARSELGRIGTSLAALASGPTRVEREVRRLVRAFALGGAGLCVLVVLVYGLTRGDWLRGLLAGLTLAMAMVPEEFPVVLAVFLALGAWRLSRRGVLARRAAAIETLGAATVLCVDKTGTLTRNHMTVRRLVTDDADVDLAALGDASLPEEVHALGEYGILASQRDPFDPMEQAFHDLGARHLAGTEHLHSAWSLVREYPLEPALLALSHVWRAPPEQGGGRYVIAAKGAPEAIADLCHLAPDRRDAVLARTAALAGAGLRVLGVARATFEETALPPIQHDFAFELVGLVGLADPVRPGVPEALAECYRAGLRVVMITGDHPATARAVAREIGLRPADDAVTGPELDALADDALAARVATASVFARVVPAQKLRLVRALQARGEVVAMTGDGVNDAPALKAAHIGVAMGGRGTDVAREAAALVITDDDFGSIVAAVRTGRRVFDNLQRALAFIVAVHVPIAGLAVLPVLLGWPLLLLPVGVAFLELVIDPACSVAFEAEPDAADAMTRPPRRPDAPLFGLRALALSVAQGAGVLAVAAGAFALARHRADLGGEDGARALAFTALLAGDLGLILVNRSWTRTLGQTLATPNRAAWWVVGVAAGVLALVLGAAPLRALFRFGWPGFGPLALAAAAGFASVLWFEVTKRGARARS